VRDQIIGSAIGFRHDVSHLSTDSLDLLAFLSEMPVSVRYFRDSAPCGLVSTSIPPAYSEMHALCCATVGVVRGGLNRGFVTDGAKYTAPELLPLGGAMNRSDFVEANADAAIFDRYVSLWNATYLNVASLGDGFDKLAALQVWLS
jgi:hypothetical protein